jgi:hypothetical protein
MITDGPSVRPSITRGEKPVPVIDKSVSLWAVQITSGATAVGVGVGPSFSDEQEKTNNTRLKAKLDNFINTPPKGIEFSLEYPPPRLVCARY